MMEKEDVSGWGPCVCGKIAIGDGRDFSVIGQGTRRYWCGDVACRPAMKLNLDELERSALSGAWIAASGSEADERDIVVALIARIRELEAAGRTLSERARFGIDDDRKIAEYDAAVEILEKGAMLP